MVSLGDRGIQSILLEKVGQRKVCLNEPSENQEEFISGKRLPNAMALTWFRKDHTCNSIFKDQYQLQKEGIFHDAQAVLRGQEIVLA